ncbi:MAG: tetratricopeptide repeat protein [Spirochaetia bacterium]|nr:tetratricopeptide repeat protein [Spirochaetia bacterium]MCF7946429.1 tetratricopeptide repeat protein [Spirochaetia bacterium]
MKKRVLVKFMIQDPLSAIIYIQIPKQLEKTIGNFSIDSSIPIPVEIPPGRSGIDLDELSWEMIVSGMLKIMAYDPGHRHITYFRNFINAVQPNLVVEMTKTGIIKAESKEYDLAEEIFSALKTLSPEEETTFLNLAFIYEEQLKKFDDKDENTRNNKEYELLIKKAVQTYQEVIEKHPDSPDAHYFAASFYLKHNNISKAKEHFELFLGLSPEDERSDSVQTIVQRLNQQTTDDDIFAEAFDMIKLGNEDKALDLIASYLERHPTIWNAWFLKGWALRRLERFSEGEQAFLVCLDYETDQADVFNELAICQMEQEKFVEAKTSLKKALHLEPENVKIISNFGILALKDGNDQEAYRYFRAAYEIDNNDPLVNHYLEKLAKVSE